MSKSSRTLSKGQRFELLEKKVAQVEMATRISQLLLQQMGNSMSPVQRDLSELASRQRELSYRMLAFQEVLAVNMDLVNQKAEEMQIRDFTEASAKEDAEFGYETAETVTEESVVTLTSKTPEEAKDKGFLRSKVKVAEVALPDLKSYLVGKKVGETLSAIINNVKHDITVLDIKVAPTPPPAVTEATDARSEQPVQ